jgi:putative addiction module killer protein
MRNTQPRDLQFYRTPNGREPFNEWYRSIRDPNTKYRIQIRLERLKDGNRGDCRSVGEGVFELRLHYGSGYRIYFGEVHHMVILVLCGGDKSSQQRDIERAKTYWSEYKETQT